MGMSCGGSIQKKKEKSKKKGKKTKQKKKGKARWLADHAVVVA